MTMFLIVPCMARNLYGRCADLYTTDLLYSTFCKENCTLGIHGYHGYIYPVLSRVHQSLYMYCRCSLTMFVLPVDMYMHVHDCEACGYNVKCTACNLGLASINKFHL